MLRSLDQGIMRGHCGFAPPKTVPTPDCPMVCSSQNFPPPRRTGSGSPTSPTSSDQLAHLGPVMDLYTASIVGWARRINLRADLPLAAFVGWPLAAQGGLCRPDPPFRSGRHICFW